MERRSRGAERPSSLAQLPQNPCYGPSVWFGDGLTRATGIRTESSGVQSIWVVRVIAAAMTYIDSMMLHVTESSCRRFQVLTGRTNIWLAAQLTNLSIVVYFVWAALYFWSAGLTTRIFVGLFCSALLSFLTQTVFKVPVEQYEQGAYRRVAQGFANPRRLRDAVLRISFLILCLGLCCPALFAYRNLRLHIAVLPYSLVLLTTVVLYLLACDPLPPCEAKLKDWRLVRVVARMYTEAGASDLSMLGRA
jgi:hypothetical protein